MNGFKEDTATLTRLLASVSVFPGVEKTFVKFETLLFVVLIELERLCL